MYNVISLDPGVRHIAWAGWIRDELAAVGLLLASPEATTDECGRTLAAACLQQKITARYVYLERMRWHSGVRRSQPNDLIDVATVSGIVAGTIGPQVHLVTPTAWKGNVPKNVMAVRTREVLLVRERKILDEGLAKIVKHRVPDVLDAVGIGLYVLRNQK